jgi:hypothetical protein
VRGVPHRAGAYRLVVRNRRSDRGTPRGDCHMAPGPVGIEEHDEVRRAVAPVRVVDAGRLTSAQRYPWARNTPSQRARPHPQPPAWVRQPASGPESAASSARRMLPAALQIVDKATIGV